MCKYKSSTRSNLDYKYLLLMILDKYEIENPIMDSFFIKKYKTYMVIYGNGGSR